MQLTSSKRDAHIYYSSHELQNYLNNAAAYIIAGIEQGDHIVFIENDRVFPLLQIKLKTLLNTQQLNQIHHVNNFDFYCSSGSFNPPFIFDYLTNTLNPYFDGNISFRVWAHVEWSEQEGILKVLEEFENEADGRASEMGLLLVCAYDADRVPDSLNTALMKCHGFIMTEDDIVPSDIYVKAKATLT
jgi:hypothetical protein